jgi:chitosanase
MSVTPEQRHVIDCVVAIFETGKVPSSKSYGTCSILNDGAGISYGKHQCTDKAGSLDLVCKKYIELNGQLSESLKQYSNYLATNESAKYNSNTANYPAWLNSLINLLKSAGSDPLMHQAQDEVFDKNYWLPAAAHCQEIGLKTALSHLVIYDTCIHSGPARVSSLRAKFPEASPSRGGDEKAWTLAFLKARRDWLSANSNPLVQKTVYRIDAMKEIADSGNWDLNAPLVVRKVKIDKLA